MRGRVLILIGIIILGGALIAALLLLNNGGDGDNTTTETQTAAPSTSGGGGSSGSGNDNSGSGSGGSAPALTDFAAVVIALQDLPRGTLITPEMIVSPTSSVDQALVDVRFWPLEFAPQTSIEDPNQLVGCRTRTDVPRESAILVAQLVPDPQLLASGQLTGSICAAAASGLSRLGSDAALFLDPTLVGISVPLDFTGLCQVAYGIQPGDRVDVLMSFLFIDVDEEFQTRRPNEISIISLLEDGSIGFTEGRPGRPEPSNVFPQGVLISPSETQQRPRLVTQRTIQNAPVIYVGWFPPDGIIFGATPTTFEEPVLLDPTQAAQQQSGAPTSAAAATPTEYIPVLMTIGVTPQDALVLAWAIDARIPICYTLRPAVQDTTLNDFTEPVSLEYMLREFGIDEPPTLPISIEPAITDIRRFDLSTLRTFAALSP
ncbi:MAG: hypothetical protein H6673_13385 [Anaerolineales bacterium]|nr:hypothetical protein [Anaerolineales bacterium]